MDGAYGLEECSNEDEGRGGGNGSNGLMLRVAGDERYGYIEIVVHRFERPFYVEEGKGE